MLFIQVQVRYAICYLIFERFRAMFASFLAQVLAIKEQCYYNCNCLAFWFFNITYWGPIRDALHHCKMQWLDANHAMLTHKCKYKMLWTIAKYNNSAPWGWHVWHKYRNDKQLVATTCHDLYPCMPHVPHQFQDETESLETDYEHRMFICVVSLHT